MRDGGGHYKVISKRDRRIMNELLVREIEAEGAVWRQRGIQGMTETQRTRKRNK